MGAEQWHLQQMGAGRIHLVETSSASGQAASATAANRGNSIFKEVLKKDRHHLLQTPVTGDLKLTCNFKRAAPAGCRGNMGQVLFFLISPASFNSLYQLVKEKLIAKKK